MNKFLMSLGMLLLVYGLGAVGAAQTLQSPGYQIEESYVGPGGLLESNSNTYQGTSTAGDITVGESSSTNYRQQGGFNTTSDPRLSVVIDTATVNFGALSTSVATTRTSTFSVLNYTSHGYSVYTIGSPPSNSGHTLSGMTPAGASQVGTEQYGINLKANTSPTTFGANPVQVPSSDFSYGAAATNYNTANNFRYVAGEKIAEATQSSGQTNYTISYIVNVATTTPGGSYTGSQSIVVVATY
jgi:hypothetical protein